MLQAIASKPGFGGQLFLEWACDFWGCDKTGRYKIHKSPIIGTQVRTIWANRQTQCGLENDLDPCRSTRSIFNLDESDNGPGSALRYPLKIGNVLEVIASGALDDVMSGKFSRTPKVDTAGIDV